MDKEEKTKQNIQNEIEKAEKEVQKQFQKIEKICFQNSQKILNAFHKYHISESHFMESTGYGYNDIGRDAIESVFQEIFKAEDALVRGQFISGTHAITTTLFGLLRPFDTVVSITGKPYDTLEKVIGITENESSLASYQIKYKQIDLNKDEFDIKKIKKVLGEKKIKMIMIQRSKGYSQRKSISIEKIKSVIREIRSIQKEVIIMVDNCYCELVQEKEPVEVGADIVVGSLIKNLGGGIAPNGAYVVGKKDLITKVAERLTVPGQGKEVGPTLGMNKKILQGLFLSPSVVASALKTAVLTSKIMQNRGYEVEPGAEEERVDIVQNIIFRDSEKLIKFCQGIQAGSPIDAYAIPMPWDMPGYEDKVIMASGSFTSGSSIELSCDGPIRKPYIAFMQGSLTYEYGKLGLMHALTYLEEGEKT